MKASRTLLGELRALLGDRKRSQQGSVLSAVLIMVAFLAIISGAITTALSTNFLLSKDLLNRVNTEATVNSAMELGLNQLQTTPLNAACPSWVATPKLNGQVAAAAVANCEAIIDSRSPQSFRRVAVSEPFAVDGTHAQLPGLNDYVVGDSQGNVLDFPFGNATPRWTLALGGSVTAAPAVVPDPSNGGQFLDLIPASGSACGSASSCVVVRSDDGSSSAPTPRCTMPTASSVTSQPAGGRNFPSAAFAGDSSGNLYAIGLTQSGTCDVEDQETLSDPIVAGPLVYPCKVSCGGKNPDYVFVVASNGTSSHLVSYAYTSKNGFGSSGSLALGWPGVSGMAVEASTLPSRLAISFAAGHVALVQIDSGANLSLVATATVGAGIAGAPYWCHCPGGLNLIGVGGGNGSLYVLDTTLATYATYAGGSTIRTSPTADAMGDWYFGADDGQLYEVQKQNSPAMVSVAQYGSAGGPIGSSPVSGGCAVGICVYLGSADGNDYLVPLDARQAVVTSCITTAAPTCSGANPRLWTRVVVGVAGSPETVHVQGWSYYSP